MMEEMAEETRQELLGMLKTGLTRKQVVVGGERLQNLMHRYQVVAVWATTDLSRHSLGKLRIECEPQKIPVFVLGTSDEVSEHTGMQGTKVYILKKSLSGYRHFVRKLTEATA